MDRRENQLIFNLVSSMQMDKYGLIWADDSSNGSNVDEWDGLIIHLVGPTQMAGYSGESNVKAHDGYPESIVWKDGQVDSQMNLLPSGPM